MRILTVSDKVEPVLYGPYIRERVGQIDLILACGDLPYYYLEYIVSLLDRPLYYVHGNHDKAILRPSDLNPLSGPPSLGWAVNLHRDTARFQGLLLAGLEGCRVYNPGAPYQYSEAQVKAQIRRLGLRLLGESAALWALPGHFDHPRAAARDPGRGGSAASRFRELFVVSAAVPAQVDDPRPPAHLQPQ